MEIRIYAFILNTQISSFSNLEFNNGGRKFRAGVNSNGNSYMQTIFQDGTIQQFEIRSDGSIESVFFNGNTWGLNWSSRNSNNAILFDGDCNDLGFGLYICEGNVKNIPDVNWYMIISAVSGGTGVQLGIALFGKDIRARSIASGVWENWSRIKI